MTIGEALENAHVAIKPKERKHVNGTKAKRRGSSPAEEVEKGSHGKRKKRCLCDGVTRIRKHVNGSKAKRRGSSLAEEVEKGSHRKRKNVVSAMESLASQRGAEDRSPETEDYNNKRVGHQDHHKQPRKRHFRPFPVVKIITTSDSASKRKQLPNSVNLFDIGSNPAGAQDSSKRPPNNTELRNQSDTEEEATNAQEDAAKENDKRGEDTDNRTFGLKLLDAMLEW